MSYQRPDGRTVDQIRNTKITANISPYAEGSALVEVGGTKVICTATVEDRVPLFLRNKGVGWVTAEYAMLPRATNTRTQRETQRPSGVRRRSNV
jgi:ribonuclease PH